MQLSNAQNVGSIRLKVAEPCNWSCGFCHNEGDKKADTIKWDEDLCRVLSILREHFNLTEVHLTGGEPTLNPHIISLIHGVKSMGMDVKMTTNGQFSQGLQLQIANSGIDSISFSLHSLNSKDLINIMDKDKDHQWGQEQIDRSTGNIIELKRSGIKLKLNTVISSVHDIPRVQDIFWWAARNSIEIRILGNLINKEESKKGIDMFIDLMGARQTKEINDTGTSNQRSFYQVDGVGSFIVKRINKVFLDGVCEKCEHFNKPSCQEGFYNIRLQKNKGKWIVILCIQNQNDETVLDLEDFVRLHGKV